MKGSEFSKSPEREKDQENNKKDLKAMLVDKYERCCFCHTKLLFTHEFNLAHYQVIESSQCPGCGAVMKPQKFSLH